MSRSFARLFSLCCLALCCGACGDPLGPFAGGALSGPEADTPDSWTFATKARVECSPVIVRDRVIVGSNDRNLHLLDLAGSHGHALIGAARGLLGGNPVREQ